MGNTAKSLSSMQVLSRPQPGEWTQIGKSNSYDILVNSQRGIECQQYIIPKDSRISELEDLQIYEFRCVSNGSLVRVYNVEKVTSNDDRAAALLRVKTERIPVRLSELKGLTFEQSLYVLRETLMGYKEVAKMHTPLGLTERMIGFNGSGKVKVWVNENYAKNIPDNNQQGQKVQQQQMVEQICGFVARHLQNGTFPAQFKAAYEHTAHTFDSLLQLITSFSQNNRLGIPDKLNLIPKSSTPVNLNKKSVLNVGAPVVTHSYSQKAINSHSRMLTVPAMNLAQGPTVEQRFMQPSQVRVSNNIQRTVTPTRKQNNRSHVELLASPIQAMAPQQMMVVSEGRLPPPSNAVSRVNLVQQPASLQIIPTGLMHERNLSPRMLPGTSIVESIVSAPNLMAIANRPKTMQPVHVRQNRHLIQQSSVTVTPVIHQTANHGLVVENRSADRFEYPRRRHIDLRNAKLLAYGQSEYLGQRTKPDLSSQVIFVPADAEVKRDAAKVQRRSTVALTTPRARSQFVKSMVSNPKSPRKGRGITTLYESRHRELRGAPILHQGYDEFMKRMKTGERPKSTYVRLSYAGRPGPPIEKRPAVFAAEKIVTSQTTVEKSPKKRYVSADPISSMSPSKNQLNQKNPKLIKFPIKKQVTVTGYERTSFEQDLEPIIKQVQSTKEIIAQKPHQRAPARRISPQQTPIKGMLSSEYVVVPSAVPNPQKAQVFPGVKTTSLASSNVKFNLINPAQALPPMAPKAVPLPQPQFKPQPVPAPSEQPTIKQQVRSKIQQHIQQLQQDNSKPSSKISANASPQPQQVVSSIERQPQLPVVQKSHISNQSSQSNSQLQVVQKSHISEQSYAVSNQSSKMSAPAFIPEPASKINQPLYSSLASSDEIMKIVEQSKKYRAGASAHLQEVKSGLKPRKAVSPTSKTSQTNVPPSNHEFDHRYGNLRYQNMSASDDFSSLRPQTLFQPKPEPNKPAYNESAYSYQPRSVPPQMRQAEPISRSYMNSGSQLEYTANFKFNQNSSYNNSEEYSENYQQRPQVDLTSTFGVHHRDQSEVEEIYYHDGPQQVEISYNKKDYEPLEYGAVEITHPPRNKEDIDTQIPFTPESIRGFRTMDQAIGHRRMASHITEESCDEPSNKNNIGKNIKLSGIRKTQKNMMKKPTQLRYTTPAIPFLPAYTGVSKALQSSDSPVIYKAGGPISPLKGISGYVPRYTPIVRDQQGFMSSANSSNIEESPNYRGPFPVYSTLHLRKALEWDTEAIYPREIISARNSTEPRC